MEKVSIFFFLKGGFALCKKLKKMLLTQVIRPLNYGVFKV